MDHIIQIDTDVFLFLNGLHNSFFDFIMYWVSTTVLWIPLWLYFIYLLISEYKKQAVWLIVALLVAVSLADSISVHLFKNVFERLRPCHNEEIASLVHIVRDHCGGKYGFVSSHAANMFAIAVFMGNALKPKFKYAFVLLLLWATLISYSRIYLGVHYPADVIGGGLLGSLIAFVIWRAISRTVSNDEE
ncbi:MAG: phosphatase PAP2 family protein [Bacteroidetes bacterium]|nr:MAG: phosphatase PAP2 family protein [Bacteroidota bacterium]